MDNKYLISAIIAIIVGIIALIVSWKTWYARAEILEMSPDADWIKSHTAGFAVSLILGLGGLGLGAYLMAGAFSSKVRDANKRFVNKLRSKRK